MAAETTRLARREPRRQAPTQPAALETRPGVAAAPASDLPAPTPVEPPSPVPAEPVQASSDVMPAAPAGPTFDELTVPADAVIGIQLTSTVSSQTAAVEDRVIGRVARDVSVDGRVVIAAGSLVEGAVTAVQRGGKFREQARLAVKFTSVRVTDELRVPVQTETIIRVADAPTKPAASKIGASAAIGAIIGGVFGGKKGAAIGGTAGAAGGTAAVMAGEAAEAVLPAGTSLTLRLTAPATFELERSLAFDARQGASPSGGLARQPSSN